MNTHALARRGLAVLAAMLAVAPSAAATPPVELGRGHVDIGPQLVGNKLLLRARDDTGATPVWRDPADVVIRVNDHTIATIPEDPRFDFLGDAVGKPVHVIPQTENPQAIWLGWNTQDPGVVTELPRGVDLVLREHRGPGAVHVFLGNGFDAPLPLWDSATPGGKIHVEPNTHVHANWVFTAPGEHALTVDLVARDKAGATRTATSTLRFLVGNGVTASPVASPTISTPAPTSSAAPTGPAAPAPSTATRAVADPGPANPASPGWLVGAIAAGSLAVLGLGLFVVRQRLRRERSVDADLYGAGEQR